VSVTVVFVLLALLLMLCVPVERSRLRAAAWLFSVALVFVLTASVLAAIALPAGAMAVYWAALVLGGIALVNLASLVVFDIALTLAISFAPYAARGRACSGSSSFSARSGVNRGMGKIPAS